MEQSGADATDKPDLTGAQVFVESAERPVAGGRWYVLPDDTVLYQRPGSETVEPATIANASTLRERDSWTEVSP